MAPRRPRLPTRDELLLWGEIAKLVTPLRETAKRLPTKTMPTKALPVEMPAVPSLALPPHAPMAELKKRVSAPLPMPGQRPVKLGDLAAKAQPIRPHDPAPVYRPSGPAGPGLERREKRGLQRGTLAIEARIDLHGLYQAEAHAALTAFLVRARGSGLSRVLVVTGKGGVDEYAGPSDRGVLRRSVPHWLRGAELRSIVLGFEGAARHHGGSGALYVRLRRR